MSISDINKDTAVKAKAIFLKAKVTIFKAKDNVKQKCKDWWSNVNTVQQMLSYIHC